MENLITVTFISAVLSAASFSMSAYATESASPSPISTFHSKIKKVAMQNGPFGLGVCVGACKAACKTNPGPAGEAACKAGCKEQCEKKEGKPKPKIQDFWQLNAMDAMPALPSGKASKESCWDICGKYFGNRDVFNGCMVGCEQGRKNDISTQMKVAVPCINGKEILGGAI